MTLIPTPPPIKVSSVIATSRATGKRLKIELMFGKFRPIFMGSFKSLAERQELQLEWRHFSARVPVAAKLLPRPGTKDATINEVVNPSKLLQAPGSACNPLQIPASSCKLLQATLVDFTGPTASPSCPNHGIVLMPACLLLTR